MRWYTVTAIIATVITLSIIILLLIPKEKTFVNCGTNETCFKNAVEKCKAATYSFKKNINVTKLKPLSPFTSNLNTSNLKQQLLKSLPPVLINYTVQKQQIDNTCILLLKSNQPLINNKKEILCIKPKNLNLEKEEIHLQLLNSGSCFT